MSLFLCHFFSQLLYNMEPTAYYVSTAWQSFRHGFAVSHPFTQGRLCAVQNLTPHCAHSICIEVPPLSVQQITINQRLNL